MASGARRESRRRQPPTWRRGCPWSEIRDASWGRPACPRVSRPRLRDHRDRIRECRASCPSRVTPCHANLVKQRDQRNADATHEYGRDQAGTERFQSDVSQALDTCAKADRRHGYGEEKLGRFLGVTNDRLPMNRVEETKGLLFIQ